VLPLACVLAAVNGAVCSGLANHYTTHRDTSRPRHFDRGDACNLIQFIILILLAAWTDHKWLIFGCQAVAGLLTVLVKVLIDTYGWPFARPTDR
jgi:hypothetical protein